MVEYRPNLYQALGLTPALQKVKQNNTHIKNRYLVTYLNDVKHSRK